MRIFFCFLKSSLSTALLLLLPALLLDQRVGVVVLLCAVSPAKLPPPFVDVAEDVAGVQSALWQATCCASDSLMLPVSW